MLAAVGLFTRWGGKGKGESRRARAARAKELAGDLAAAVELYVEAEMPDDAARVLLLRADAERSPEKRMAFCSLAAQTATGDEMRKRALARKAKLGFDILRSKGGAFMQSELVAVARELEQAGELERAADAYALAGDTDSEVRALTAAGAIERLEERLRASDAAARDSRDQDFTLRKITDLDRTAERRAALELAASWLATHEDERVAEAARAIRARLARGPVIDVEIDGAACRYALGDEVTIGRGDATIMVASRAISRRHVRIFRKQTGEVMVEDLATRNGTTLAGARLGSPIPVGAGVELLLGGEIPCAIAPGDGGCHVVEVGGEKYLAPLGEALAGDWRLLHEAAGESFVVLRTPPGAPRPYLGGYELSAQVELCVGDQVRTSRNGPVKLTLFGGRPQTVSSRTTDGNRE